MQETCSRKTSRELVDCIGRGEEDLYLYLSDARERVVRSLGAERSTLVLTAVRLRGRARFRLGLLPFLAAARCDARTRPSTREFKTALPLVALSLSPLSLSLYDAKLCAHLAAP